MPSAVARKTAGTRPPKQSTTTLALEQLDDAIAARQSSVVVALDGAPVQLTNVGKAFFPAGAPRARTKGDMLRFYLRIAPVILPHLRDRPVVLTRYPDGVTGKGFYVQRAPETRPSWVSTCLTSLKPPKEVEYLTIDSVAMLLWVANLAGFEIHPWYSRCSATTKPDYLVIDLDPVPGVTFRKVRTAALHVRDALDAWALPGFVKTSGATGLHLFVPIRRGPSQREVHDVARDVAGAMEAQFPTIFTTEYRIANRPEGRVLLDHNQNALGHHLAGAYVVRPRQTATVSTPIAWSELEDGADPRDFTMATVPERMANLTDPWSEAAMNRARIDLVAWRAQMLDNAAPKRGRRRKVAT